MNSRRSASRGHKSNKPHITIVTPEDDYDPSIMKENIPPRNEEMYNFDKPKVKKTTSLASKFSKKWEHIPSCEPIKYAPEPSEVSISDDIPVMEIPGDFSDCDDEIIPQQPVRPQPTVTRNSSNQSAESILQDIDSLVNRVKEICGEQANKASYLV
ncbi:hypothetical protein TRFO_09947 [Tritrichomonas foetus]|uniref:Uncharacterized protein n=1 Tax=Tritrichomonas foetus TaxID=1144522 RepID=A0A1J4JBH6_9EUKA|nr:hypothetical protein TRFO_09947 [Tritrichomonas foetus]|eukprot:OHS96546.1 hypothetical protein TRFO_09947 [Tritrichomonas foetus]